MHFTCQIQMSEVGHAANEPQPLRGEQVVASQIQDLHLGHAGQIGHASVCERLLAVHAGRADIQIPAHM